MALQTLKKSLHQAVCGPQLILALQCIALLLRCYCAAAALLLHLSAPPCTSLHLPAPPCTSLQRCLAVCAWMCARTPALAYLVQVDHMGRRKPARRARCLVAAGAVLVLGLCLGWGCACAGAVRSCLCLGPVAPLVPRL